MNSTPQRISWQAFKVKNEHSTRSFEELCYHLFCRRYKLDQGIRADYNQKGLETYPVTRGRETIGFQAKFFENKLADPGSVKQINHSVKNAKEAFPELTKIIIYTHYSFGARNPVYKQQIESHALPVKIEWFVDSNFQAVLFTPKCLDLAYLYFGIADEMGFVRNSSSSAVLTLLQAAEFITLPIVDENKLPIGQLRQTIIDSPAREILISGNPGSGKSIILHKLFQEFAGLDQKDDAAMMRIVGKQGAVPMLINLKNCTTDSLESLVRQRQNDNNVRGKQLRFIYLFDGLDELGDAYANRALHYMTELSTKADTYKIIISCRSGSMNRTNAKIYLKDIVDYNITFITEVHIDKYFQGKKDKNRTNKLKIQKEKNPDLITEVKDILLIAILWEVIETLSLKANIIELFQLRIDKLINSPNHRKNLDELNLPYPKTTQLLELNQDISFAFYKKYQFRFPQNELQEIIGNKWPRLDYHSINVVLQYLAEMFFDNDYLGNSTTQSYIYEHRRYQEYFFAQRLKTAYEKNPKILRELQILSSYDFFESLFLPYLRNEYEKQQDLMGLLGINLIGVYLGHHRGWGADNAYYKDSQQFIQALAAQNEFGFEQLLNDENLELKNKLLIDKGDISDAFVVYAQRRLPHHGNTYLKNIWEEYMPNLITLTSILHQNNKTALGNEIERQFLDIEKLFKDARFEKNYEKATNDRLYSPRWKEWEHYLYKRIVIDKDDLGKLYTDYILKNYSVMPDDDPFETEEEGREKLMKGFLRVCLNDNRPGLLPILPKFDEFQFICLVEVLTGFNFLPVFFSDLNLQKIIKERISTPGFYQDKFNAEIVFFKKVLSLPIPAAEKTTTTDKLVEIRRMRDIDIRLQDIQYQCALLSYADDRYVFESMLDEEGMAHDYYDVMAVFLRCIQRIY